MGDDPKISKFYIGSFDSVDTRKVMASTASSSFSAQEADFDEDLLKVWATKIGRQVFLILLISEGTNSSLLNSYLPIITFVPPIVSFLNIQPSTHSSHLLLPYKVTYKSTIHPCIHFNLIEYLLSTNHPPTHPPIFFFLLITCVSTHTGILFISLTST
jgi:hypothetical protein